MDIENCYSILYSTE